MDTNEKLKQGKQAALAVGVWGFALSVVIAIAVGFFFADAPEPLLRRSHFAVAAFGFIVTFTIVVHILTQDIAQHHYRENLKAEKEAERAEAEIAELNARAQLYAAKERAQYTPLPGRVARALPEPSAPVIYRNGERVGDAIEDANEDLPIEERSDAPSAALVQTAPNQWRFVERSSEPANDSAAGVSARGQTIITESADAYRARIRNLARAIYDLCRDVDAPTQKVVEERITLTADGMLRSHSDITAALDLLAEQNLVEESKGKGIKRYWLHRGGRVSAQTQTRIEANVRVEQ